MGQGELRLRGLPRKTRDELKAIAKNSGVTLTALIKPHLVKLADSYPPQMKRSENDNATH